MVPRFLTAIFMSTIYGIDVVERDDPYIVSQKRASRAIAMATTPGTFIVESFPLREPPSFGVQHTHQHSSAPTVKYLPTWFPFVEFKKMAVKWQDDAHDALWRPFKAVRKDLVSHCNLLAKRNPSHRLLSEGNWLSDIIMCIPWHA